MAPAASDAEIVSLSNDMLEKLNVGTRVRSRKDVDSELFVTLFEGICGETLRDVIHSPHSVEEHAHNVQAVIDTLSMDVLNTSLSHITGHDVVSGSTRATHNLLEVLFGVMDFILEEISSGESSGDVSRADSDLIGGRLNGRNQGNFSRDADQVISSCSTDNQSPLSTSDVQHVSISSGSQTDRTSDLIALGEGRFLSGRTINLPQKSAGTMPTTSLPTKLSSDRLGSAKDIVGASSYRSSPFHSSQPLPTSDRPPSQPLPTSDRSPSPLSRVESRARSLHASTLSHRSGSALSAFQSKPSVYQSTAPMVGTVKVGPEVPTSRYQFRPYESTAGGTNVGADSSIPLSADRFTVGTDSSIPLSTDRFLSQSRHYQPLSYSSVLPERDVETAGGKLSAAASLPAFSSRSPGETAAPSGTKSSSRSYSDVSKEKTADDRESFPKTYEEYLKKYYGSASRSQKLSAADDSYLSDGCIDYEPSATLKRSGSLGSSRSFGAELEQCKRELARKAKAVRFEDYLDSAARGRTGPLRRRFRGEESKTRIRKELLSKTYEDELVDLECEQKEEMKGARKSLKEKSADYETLLNKKRSLARLKTNKYAPSKSVIIARQRPTRKRSISRNKKRSKSASPSLNRTRMPSTGAELLPWLLEEFPFLQISPTTLLSLEKTATQQLEYLAKTESQAMRRKSKAQEQIEEAEKRQDILLGIIKKEHAQRMRWKEMKERTKGDLSVQGSLRDKRVQSARVRKYYDEYQVRQRSKMLKRRSKEELMFKQLFLDSLGIEKERILELRKYAKEQRELRAKKQKDELASIENFYKDKFDMMMEKMQKSREEIDIRDKEQAKMVEKMKRELRKKMEREIEQLQEKIWTDEDDIYFRELDADRVRQQLNLARYQSRV